MRINVVTLHVHYDPAHLAAVKVLMGRLGVPRLHGHFDRETSSFFLYEGTHRIRACAALGLTPVLVDCPWRKGGYALARARYRASLGVNEHGVFLFEGAGIV